MEKFMKSIRDDLRKYETVLKQDDDEFNRKLNLVRQQVSNYFDRQIEYLVTKKRQYNDQFNYLDEENKKTYEGNQQRFDKLCLFINQNDHNQKLILEKFQEFEQTFPTRPKMLKQIPEYNFEDINIDDFIKIQTPYDDSFVYHDSSPSILHEKLLSENINPSVPHTEHLRPSADQYSYTPINSTINDDTKIQGSIGHSYHKQFAEENNEPDTELQSHSISTCTSIPDPDAKIDLLFKISYQHNRQVHLITFNENENSLLIYSLFSKKLEYLSLNSQQISSINLPLDEQILNLGYSRKYQIFYLTTRQKNRFLLFQIKQQNIEIKQEIELIKEKEHFISVHVYENFICFLYLSSSSIVMFGKYDLEESSFLPLISFENKLYDAQEKSSYSIIDFTINNSYISFLIRLKKNNKYMIIIHDYEYMNKIHSFDLIDAGRPLSIISTEKKSNSAATTVCNEDIQLLFVNDARSHFIHCCSHQEYLTPIQVNAFGICSLNDGNLALVGSRDIRGLNVDDFLKSNNVQFD